MERADAKTYAWILLAIFFWDKDLVTMDEVRHSADAINGRPSEGQLQRAILFLAQHGLIEDVGDSFAISDAGREMLEAAQEGSRNVFDIWTALEPRIASLEAM